MKCRGLAGWVSGIAWVAAAVAQADPTVLWVRTHAAGGTSIYFGGAVKDHQFYTGQLTWGPQAWDNAGNMVGGYSNNVTAKCSVPVGSYVFFTHAVDPGGGVFRINNDWQTDLVGPVYVAGIKLESLATDGTHLYSNDDNDRDTICKYEINNSVGSFTLTPLMTATCDVTRICGISYHDGKLYAASSTTTTNVVEVDANTGVSTNLFALPPITAKTYFQAVRSGNRIYVVGTGTAYQLFVYETHGTSWTAVGSYNLGLGPLYGISDVDEDCVWVTGSQKIAYVRLEPKKGSAVVEF